MHSPQTYEMKMRQIGGDQNFNIPKYKLDTRFDSVGGSKMANSFNKTIQMNNKKTPILSQPRIIYIDKCEETRRRISLHYYTKQKDKQFPTPLMTKQKCNK